MQYHLNTVSQARANRGLWRDHPATSRQQSLAFKPASATRPTQADVLLRLLRERRVEKRSLDLPEIMAAGIAQYSARMHELRERGFEIHNWLSRSPEGRTLSCYRLIYDPEIDEPQGTLFGDLAPETGGTP